MAQITYTKLGLKPDLDKVEVIQISAEHFIEIK